MVVIDNTGKVYEPIIDDNRIVIKKEEIVSGVEYLEFQLEEWNAEIGEEGYYIIADANKKGSLLCYFTDKDEEEYIFKQNTLPIFGVKKQGTASMLIAEGMKYSFYMKVGLKDGKYYAAARFVLDGDIPYEDVSLIKVDLGKDADYSDMANY